MFATVSGDATGVGFSWWSVEGATGYEMLRTPNPQQTPAKLASLPNTTLGYRDTHPATKAVYYQLVALGPAGKRVPGDWIQYAPPVIQSVSAAKTGVTVRWASVPNAPGGYEIWRAPQPQQHAVRVGAVSSTTLSYLDKQAGSAPFFYQVVAIEFRVKAASPWVSTNAGSTSSTTSQESAFAAQLAKELSTLGVDVDPAELTDITNALTRGGPGAMAIASYITGKIAETGSQSHSQQVPTGGDPTNQDASNTTPPADGTSSQQEINAIIAKLSLPENSHQEISQVLLRLLNKPKKK